MSSLMEKEQAHKLVDRMPENATWDDLIYEIYVREVIERGLADGNPGGFNEQPSQLRMAPLRHSSNVFFLTTSLSVWNQSNVTGQLVQRRETRDLTQFRQQDHGCQRADPGNRLQQTDKGPVLLRSGQAQDGPVQRGDQLAQMAQFLQVGLEGDISTGSFHPNPLNPLDESSGPMAHLPFFRNHHSIKEKDGFNLVFAPRLLPHHALTSPDQTAIFQLPSGRNVDSFNLPIPKTPGKFAAVDWIPFLGSFFVPGRHIGRVDHDAVDPLCSQLVMNPETAKTSLVDRIILSTRKVTSKIIGQLVHFGRLGKCFMLAMLSKNAHAPALLVDIQTDVNRLTRKIKFVTLIHGKPPFGVFLFRNQNYSRNVETCLFFFNSFVQKARRFFFESYPQGYRERRDFSPALSGGAGRA